MNLLQSSLPYNLVLVSFAQQPVHMIIIKQRINVFYM